MPEQKWEKPIEVGFGVQGYRTVNGPFEALICLTDMWPNRSGARFISARTMCKAALDGRRTVEEAKTAFLAAAEEAHLTTH